VRVASAAGPLGGFAPGERLPVSVSISHAEGLALCAAALSGPDAGRPRRTVGIDLGALELRSPALVATFFTEDEQRFVRDAPWWERDLRANLVWGAKEAVLKALGLGLSVDTVGLCCLPAFRARDGDGWSISPSGAEWRPFRAACSPTVLPRGGTVHGVWRTFPGLVAAVAWHAAS
jgi:hypothetical protein